MNQSTQSNTNREYKDRLFKFIFREKRDLLELYNALNDTAYDNPEDIVVNTLEDVVYMGMRNDISFLLQEMLNLYEHQSTMSPNLPLRGLLYFAALYRKLLVNHEDLYSSRRIALPLPRFVIFYNGTKEEPERMTLYLHDSFPEKYRADDADLDCRATLININAGHNQELLKKCRRLEEYSIFVEKVREYQRKDYSMEQAIDLAVEECVQNGILENVLRENREEVRSMLLTEYNEQAHIENERKIAADEAFEQGMEIGMEQGLERGMEQGLEKGMEQGLERGMEQGIKTGTERFALLTKRLMQEARTDALLRATEEKEFREKLYEEYGI
ncbi:MAG: hypothetical protein J6K53_08135 [Roseburia sp.]|nr:hypothetical protein [Roseburia sp.]